MGNSPPKNSSYEPGNYLMRAVLLFLYVLGQVTWFYLGTEDLTVHILPGLLQPGEVINTSLTMFFGTEDLTGHILPGLLQPDDPSVHNLPMLF